MRVLAPANNVRDEEGTDMAFRHTSRGLAVRTFVASCSAIGVVASADALRRADAFATSRAGGLLNGSVRSVVADTHVLVVPGSHTPFFASITASCSSAAPVAVVALLGLLLTRTWGWRPLLRIVVACGVAAAVNIARLVVVITIGSAWGRGAMLTAHDWVGTAITFAGVVAGLAIVVRGGRRAARDTESAAAGTAP